MKNSKSRESPRRDAAPDFDLSLATFQKPASDDGLSLDALSAAFARMLERGSTPYCPPEEQQRPLPEALLGHTDLATESASRNAPQPPTGDPGVITPRGILEAILFVGNPQNEPVLAEQLTALMRGVRQTEIEEMIDELNAEYEANACPYRIVSEGSGFRLVLRAEYEPLRDRCYSRNSPARLSKPAMEVLSIVAYQQPIEVSEIARLRGKSSGALLRQLLRRGLIALEPADAGSRTRVYRTTERFLQLFGLASLEDLPQLDDARVY